MSGASRGLAPGIQQIVAQAAFTPAGAFVAGTGFGFSAITIITPLQVHDLQVDADISGIDGDVDDGCVWQAFMPTVVGANYRRVVLADDGTATGQLRVSITDNAAVPALANQLVNCRVRGWRFLG